MESIRRGVFETNSSSTHSITMCSENDYDRWKKGELLYNRWNEEFKTKEQILEDAKKTREEYLEKQKNGETLYYFEEKYIKAETDEDLMKILYNEDDEDDNDWYTYERYWDYITCGYETFKVDYTTKNGEKIISFGYYGYDGQEEDNEDKRNI